MSSDVIRVYVGCAANHEDAESQAVLEWSLRKHCSLPVDLVWMKLSRDPESPFFSDGGGGWQTQDWATPFSGFRWAVPYLRNYEGRAVYVDSDFVVLADLAELWRTPIPPGKLVLGRGHSRLCLSLWDCAAARGLDLGRVSRRGAHAELTAWLAKIGGCAPLDAGWNCLDGSGFPDLGDPALKALHYTAMEYQPQLPWATARLAREGRRHWYDGETRPHWRADLRALFERYLVEAEHNGYGVDRYCQDPIYGEYRKRSFRGRSPRSPRT